MNLEVDEKAYNYKNFMFTAGMKVFRQR